MTSTSVAPGNLSPGSSDRPPWLALLLGVVLVTHSLFVPVADLASASHAYERAKISAAGTSLQWEQGLHSPLQGIDCFEDPDYSCTVERALTTGNVTVDKPPAHGRSPDPYVALAGGWYERTTTETDDSVTYSLEPVDAETVLESVAREPRALPDALAPAANGSRITLHDPIDETYVVRDGDTYYYLTHVDTTRLPLADYYRAASIIGTLVDAILLVRAGRAREAFDREE